jgi:hypothetical protein
LTEEWAPPSNSTCELTGDEEAPDVTVSTKLDELEPVHSREI